MQAEGVAMRALAFEPDFSAQIFASQRPVAPAAVRVSAIIVTFNTGASLWECLECAAADPSLGEVVIVNNGNPGEQESSLRAFVAQHADKFVLLDGHGNVGFAKACNMGAQRARGAYLLFLNPDAVLQPGSVEALIDAGRARSGIWLAGGRLLDVFGKEQRGARRGKLTIWNAASSFSGLSGIMTRLGGDIFKDVHREKEPLPTEPVAMPTVSGALMLTPAAHFKQIGGFDESYFLHVEDIDLCRRIGEEGGSVLFTPLAAVKHYGATSKVSRFWVEWQKGRGLDIYFRKFASTPMEHVLAFVLSPVIRVALMARIVVMSIQLQHRTANMKRLRAIAEEKRAGEEDAPTPATA